MWKYKTKNVDLTCQRHSISKSASVSQKYNEKKKEIHGRFNYNRM